MTTHAIYLEGIAKTYSGRQGPTVALDGVDLQVKSGELFGLVGANGSGKTTLAKVLSGILKPDAGVGKVNGFDVVAEQERVLASTTLIKSGGWTGLLYHSSVRDNIRHYGLLAGTARAQLETRVEEMLTVLDLKDKANELPWHLSAGQRQKLCLAMAGMVITPLVILDEPTTHLDPAIAHQVRLFIKDSLNQRRGQTVLLLTHYLDEAEQLCDRVAFLHRGRVIACGTPSELAQAAQPWTILELGLVSSSKPPTDELQNIAGVDRVHLRLDDPVAGHWRVRVCYSSGNPASSIVSLLKGSGIDIRYLNTARPTLYDAYFALVGGGIAW